MSQKMRRDRSPPNAKTISIPGLCQVDRQKLVQGQALAADQDWVAMERPLSIRLVHGRMQPRQSQTLSLTLRTPGQDADLIRGYLYCEGIISDIGQIIDLKVSPSCHAARAETAEVELCPSVDLDWQKLSRFGLMNAACGACGKRSEEQLFLQPQIIPKSSPLRLQTRLLKRLAQALARNQLLFNYTGGVHAAAIVSDCGDVLLTREDVGRHNALDKAIGAYLCQAQAPFDTCILVLSGRLSFELVQKAAMVGITMVLGFGAPSSLAIETAERFGICLGGFLTSDSCSFYTGTERLDLS